MATGSSSPPYRMPGTLPARRTPRALPVPTPSRTSTFRMISAIWLASKRKPPRKGPRGGGVRTLKFKSAGHYTLRPACATARGAAASVHRGGRGRGRRSARRHGGQHGLGRHDHRGRQGAGGLRRAPADVAHHVAAEAEHVLVVRPRGGQALEHV